MCTMVVLEEGGTSWHPPESSLRVEEQNELFLIGVNAIRKKNMAEGKP